jgi:hypothetical protein
MEVKNERFLRVTSFDNETHKKSKQRNIMRSRPESIKPTVAQFSVNDFHSSLYLVLRIAKPFHGNLEKDIAPYLKPCSVRDLISIQKLFLSFFLFFLNTFFSN